MNKEMRQKISEQYINTKWNTDSGISCEELEQECELLERKMCGESKAKIKSAIMELILTKAQINVIDCEWFVDKINHGEIMRKIRGRWQHNIEENCMGEIISKNKNAEESYAYTASADFGHTAPDWENVVNLGIFGLKERMKKCESSEFKDCGLKVLNAVLAYMRRLADEAKRCDSPIMRIVSESMMKLTKKQPDTLWEAMQTIFIYYSVHHRIEAENLRSIGRIDKILYPFYKRDKENGGCGEEQARELIRHFLLKFNAVGDYANIPFALGGLDEDGNEVTNELTYMILDEYIKLDIHDPKLHIRYNKNTSEKLIKTVLESIRDGKNSFVFMNDDVVIKALMNIGQEEREARNYLVIGCYEPAACGKEVPCTCNGIVNVPKAVEYALTGGVDLLNGKRIGYTQKAETFEDYYNTVKLYLKEFIERSAEKISEYEKYYMDINPSPLFSATMDDCVLNGRDVYAGGAKYNNSSIVIMGIANAVDSLIVIKKLVFEEKRYSAEELGNILRVDWNGYEDLRTECIKCFPKYGNNNAETDELASDICGYCAKLVNNRKNGRGGVFRFGVFSIDWRMTFGKFTAAGADGRRKSTPLSKNMCASVGMDKGGVTALMHSAASVNQQDIPDGIVLDISLHPTAVSGKDGLEAFCGLVKAYMRMGGMALQINVLDTETLKKAQKNPEQYKNLQIRLCGWNVHFVELSKSEQDEFIKISESLA